ncbi:MAG: RnfH family protein [Betaproteobacteria bacterium]
MIDQSDSGVVSQTMRIEIVWIELDADGRSGAASHRVELPTGATVSAALSALARIDLADHLAAGMLSVAIFGEHATPNSVLHDGDRIELLGPLLADPKASRARRAEVQRRRRGDVRWQRR